MKHRKRAGAKLLLHSLQQQANRLQLQEQQLETDNVCLSVQISLLASCCDLLHTLRTGSVHPGWHLWLGCKESWLPEELPLLRELSDTLPESTACNCEQRQQRCLLHDKQQLQERHYVQQVLLGAPAAVASQAAQAPQQDPQYQQHHNQQQQQDMQSHAELAQQQQQQDQKLQLADHHQQEQKQPHQQQRLQQSIEQQPVPVQVQEQPQQLNLDFMQRLPGVHTRPHSLTESNSVASTSALAVGGCPALSQAAAAAAPAAVVTAAPGGGRGDVGSGAAREGAPEQQQQQGLQQLPQQHLQQRPQHAQQHNGTPQAQQYFLTTQGDYLVALRHALSLPPYQGAATMTIEGFRDYYSGFCKEMALNLALAQQQGREDDMCCGGVHPLLRLRELILQQAHVVSTLMLLHSDGLMNKLRVVNLNTLELSDEADKSWRRMDWLADQLELDAKQEATLISGTALFKRLLEHNRQERQQLSAQQGVQAEQRLATGRAVDLQAQTDTATRLSILLKKEQLLMVMASLFTAGCLSVVQTAKAAVLCWPFIPTLGILGAVLAARKA